MPPIDTSPVKVALTPEISPVRVRFPVLPRSSKSTVARLNVLYAIASTVLPVPTPPFKTLNVLPSEAVKFLPKLNSELMKIAKTGVIKKQNASRNISRITRKISSL